MKNVEECEKYILDIPKFKTKTLLSDTVDFYKSIGSPASDIPVIHVAGTNGKGSTCFYISRILKEHGLSVGLFTSPHLVSMKERFSFDDEIVDDDLFLKAFDRVYEGCELLDESETVAKHPSFFEYLFLMFMAMAEIKRPDVIVLETGLGGLLDATNIMEKPALTVICSVSIDHTMQLGDTLEEIASQKAGIIKRNVPLVAFENAPSVNDIILKTAEKNNAPVYFLKEENIEFIEGTEKSIAFSTYFEYDSFTRVHIKNITLPTSAMYQRFNSSLAIMAAKVYLKDEFDASLAKRAVEEKNFVGRLEKINDRVYVDGAHNVGAVKRLLETLSYNKHTSVLIYGACVDKDYKTILEMISQADVFDTVILTRLDSSRSASTKELSNCIAKDSKIKVFEADNLASALEIANKSEETVYIAGSLYLVGEAKALFETK